MSATIMMPIQFDEAIKSMCTEAVLQAVAVLAAKYDFDQEDAIRELNLGEIKLVRKRGPVSKSEEKPVKKSKKVTKEPKEPKEPKAKRATTGYLMFAKEMRPTVRDELTETLEEGAKLKPQLVVTEIAVRWKSLEQEERDLWNAKAKEAATPEISDTEIEATEE